MTAILHQEAIEVIVPKWITFPTNQIVSQMEFMVVPGRPMRMTVVWVDSALSDYLLKFNLNNRVIDWKHVAKLRSILDSGNWDLINGATVAISYEQVVMDAQHRLLAISGTDHVVPMIIVEGLDPSAGDSIDSETKGRTVGNILQRRGVDVPNVGVAVAVARLFLQTEYGLAFTKEMQADYVQANAQEWAPTLKWAKALSAQSPVTKVGHGNSKCITPGALAALHLWVVYQGADSDSHTRFAEGVATGICRNESERTTFAALRRRLVDAYPLQVGGSAKNYPHILADYAVWIHTFNRWMAGETVQACKNFKIEFATLSDLPTPAQG